MIDVYAFATPNSVKVPIALEELGLAYALHSVNIRTGDHKAPAFLALNANAKVPVIVDRDAPGEPLVVTESAAILVYLAEKAGKLLPTSGAARARVFEQLFFHASGLGPAFGNAGFFTRFAPEPMPVAIDRFRAEGVRILGLLDAQLAKTPFVAGDAMTIADIAHFGWLWRRAFAGFDFDAAPHLARWYADLEARPAFQRAIEKTNALAPA
ncbi:MAG: glutathione S-transferase N-terminal domain-containing protein [Hyphomonadaceae bacterium]|nr:glutathione S-transferase N-terminal domain-containing protein [Hyphomonadaceae bacterium]